MAQIPSTQKKLRETKFFLSLMRKAAHSMDLEREDFDFYLSAFLSAGRSVTWFLQKEQKKSYDAWYLQWSQALLKDEQELLHFMNDQRTAEVHQKGAETQRHIESVPITDLEWPYRHPYHYGFILEDAPGIPPPEVGLDVRYFEVGGKREKALDVRKHYLDLLDRLLREFDLAFP